MSSLVPVIKGSVKIEILRDGAVVHSHETPNTLVLEAPKIMLGNLIAPNLTGDTTASFSDTTGQNRPVISAGGFDGPSSKLAITYLRLGYYEDGSSPANVVVSPTDKLPMGSPDFVTMVLTGVSLGEYSVQFICSFDVDESSASRNYFEAALLCPALSDQYMSGPAPDPNDPNSFFDEAHQVMFAHQTHNSIQADAGSTIRYTWTITMQDPSNT